KPDAFVRELLKLRQRGAYASVRMTKRLLAHGDPADGRIRGALRIYGGAPGRWSSPGPPLHNLRRNDAEYPASLVDALIAGDRTELAHFGNPLGVAAGLSRARCAPSRGTRSSASTSAPSKVALTLGLPTRRGSWRASTATTRPAIKHSISTA